MRQVPSGPEPGDTKNVKITDNGNQGKDDPMEGKGDNKIEVVLKALKRDLLNHGFN